MANGTDPDQLASLEANWSGSHLASKKPTDLDLHCLQRQAYLGLTGPELRVS